ncbi:hypothetical protein, partial [Ruminococcus callidus]
DEKFDDASVAQSLCGIALTFLPALFFRKTLVISAEISYNKNIHKHFPAKNVRKPASIQQQSIRCCKRGST